MPADFCLLLARSLLHSCRQADDGFPVTGRQVTTTFGFELLFIAGMFLGGGKLFRADAQLSVAVHPYLDLVANLWKRAQILGRSPLGHHHPSALTFVPLLVLVFVQHSAFWSSIWYFLPMTIYSLTNHLGSPYDLF